jgi:hypothetical protein
MKIIILSLLLFFLLSIGYSQDCTGFHQYRCSYADYTFFYSRQSKSIQFRKGQSSEFQIIAYGGEEYYLAVCGSQKLDKIRFCIIEDNPEKTVLYDNATNEYLNSINFINEVTRNLIIQLSVPEGSARESKNIGCIGFVIQLRKIGQGN